MTDLEIIQTALKHARSFTDGLRYCGQMKLYRETVEALEALQRLKQPSLWEEADDEAEADL